MSDASSPQPCPFCGSVRKRAGALPPDRLIRDGAPVDLLACTGCGTCESIPGPPSAKPPEQHYLPHTVPTGMKGWLTDRSQDRKVSLLVPWAGQKGIVDLGCGAGGFLAAWRRARPRDSALGLENDADAAALCRSRGLDVLEYDLGGTLPAEAGGRSLYSLWHVLEHLDDPAGLLDSIGQIMDSDGHIVVAVPNAAGLERTVFRSRTIAWDPPRHRWHFTPEGVTALSRLAGLEVRDRFNLLSDDIYDAVTSLQWALYPRFWVDRHPLRSPATTALALLGGIPLGLGLALVAPWRGRASLGVVLGR